MSNAPFAPLPAPLAVGRRAFVAGGALTALGALAACSSSSSTSAGASSAGATQTGGSASAAARPTSSVPTELEDGMGSGATDGVFPRTVKHHQGETVIDAAPTKVVVISTGQADAMLTLGSCPIGSTAASGTQSPVAQYLKDAYPDQAGAIAAITYVGSRTAPNIEAITGLSPDLILTNISGKDDADALYQSLSAIAPTVSMHGTGQYWKVDFLLLADALGKREAAQNVLTTLASDAAQKGAAADTTKTVSLLRRNGDKLRVFGTASFAGSVVADMGLPRPETQTFTDKVSHDISAENLDQADGDWLFYGVQGGDESKLTGESLWPSLTAVTTGHAVEVDDDPFFLNAGPTAARVVLDKIASTISA